jgi:hypothetical protein
MIIFVRGVLKARIRSCTDPRWRPPIPCMASVTAKLSQLRRSRRLSFSSRCLSAIITTYLVLRVWRRDNYPPARLHLDEVT